MPAVDFSKQWSCAEGECLCTTMAISCIPFGAGEINCALTLLCQMIGNLVAMIAALQMVMTSPYENVAGVDKNAMMSFATNVIYSRIVAGMCVTMIFGNCYYAWMAWRMMRREKTTNVCCLPYGINTPAAFAFIFSVVAKAAKEVAATGMSWEEGVLYAWRVGCVANLVSGIIATLRLGNGERRIGLEAEDSFTDDTL